MNYLTSIKKFITENVVMSLILLYNLMTLVFFYIAPLHFPNRDDIRIPIVVLTSLTGLTLGYIYAGRVTRDGLRVSPLTFGKRSYSVVLIVFTLISIIDSYFIIARQAGAADLYTVFTYVFEVILNPGLGYARNQQLIHEMRTQGGSIMTKISSLVAPLTYVSLVIGTHALFKVSKKLKALVIVNFIVYLVSYIIIGTNVGIFIFMIIVATVLLFNEKVANFIKTHKRRFIYICIIVMISFVLIFFINVHSRAKRTEIPETFIGIDVNQDSFMLNALPTNVGLAYMYITTYTSHAYSGLGYTFDEEWMPTFGFGSGRSIVRYGNRLPNINISVRTYQWRLHDTWNSTVNWFTAYSWMANDVSYFGVPFLLFFYGFMYKYLIYRATKNCLIALGLIPLYTLMLIFLPSNNVLFSNTYYMFPFLILHFVIAVYVVFKRDFVKIVKKQPLES